MATVMDYLDWRGDISFSSVSLNEVDALILSLFNYVDIKFEGKEKLNNIAKEVLFNMKTKSEYELKEMGRMEKNMTRLFLDSCKTSRFKSIYLIDMLENISEKNEMQFQAMTFLLDDDSIVVTYKGTDDSLLGFKEDFNMSLNEPVQGQIFASEYLKSLLNMHNDKRIYVAGHSKGGNFAVYSVSLLEDEDREKIKVVYNFDGPGYTGDFLESSGYEKTIPKVRKYVPKDSVVGVLMSDRENITIVDAGGWSGFDQHDGLSWKLKGQKFLTVDSTTGKSEFFEKKMNVLINEINSIDRKKFVDNVYKILTESMNITNVKELENDKIKLVYDFLQNLKELDKEDRENIQNIFMKFIKG